METKVISEANIKIFCKSLSPLVNLDVNELRGSTSELQSNDDESLSASVNLDVNELRGSTSELQSNDDESLSASVNLDVNELRGSTSELQSNDDDQNQSSSENSHSVCHSEVAIFENKVDIMIKEKFGTEELNNLLDSLIKQLKKLKKDQLKFIKFLKAKKDVVDQSYKRKNVAVSISSGISAVGGVTMLIGTASAFCTLGASFGLVLAGGLAVGIGTFSSITVQIISKVQRWQIIRQCNKELKEIKLSTEEIGKTYKEFCSKCEEVSIMVVDLELTIENMKKLDPIIFKFAMIGWLNTQRVAAVTGAVTGTNHVVRGSNVAAHVGKFLHLKLLGKAIVPSLKITQAVLGMGMALSGIGIAFDLVIGGIALYELAKGKECCESKKISLAINEANNHVQLINSYLQLVEHDAADLVKKAIQSTKTAVQQITDQAETIEKLKRENAQLKKADERKATEIEQLRTADHEKTIKIEQLRRADEENKANIKKLFEMIQPHSK